MYIFFGVEDCNLLFVDELRGCLVIFLGGCVVEEVVYYGCVFIGFFDDIKCVIDLVYKVVVEYGFSFIIGLILLVILFGGGFDDIGSFFFWGKDQVIFSFLVFGFKFMDDGDISN